MSLAIETESLTRSFGSHTAVVGLDLQVGPGDIFGLLGPNGAGKTTTIRMLTTLLAPSAGTARVCGYDILRQPQQVRRCLGYVMQSVPWQVNRLLKAREILEIEAALYHVPRAMRKIRVEAALDLVGLLSHADRQIGEFSGGMHKRLDLACGLLHRPKLLILDEPTLGLDVQSRHRVWDHIEAVSEEGVTVLLATNYLDEADRLCNRIAIIDSGTLIVGGSPDELKRAVGADVIQAKTAVPERLQRAIEGQPWANRMIVTSDEIHIYVEDAAVALPEVMRLSLENNVELERMTYSQPTLDDVFLLHTGRDPRDLEMSQ